MVDHFQLCPVFPQSYWDDSGLIHDMSTYQCNNATESKSVNGVHTNV
jgi:hypothetical protein